MTLAAPFAVQKPAEIGDETDLFPFIIVRIAGGSFDDLIALEVDIEGDLLTSLRSARAARDAARAVLGDEIFGAVGGCTDVTVRRALLAARRDLFNDRGNPLDGLRELPDARLPGLPRYEEAAALFDSCRKTFEAEFLQRQVRARRFLQGLAASETFQKPLMLASRTLLDELPAYLHSDPQLPSPKQLHIERSVIKYVTRAHAKTSPFSTFGRLALAEERDLGDATWLFDESLAFTSQVRISNLNWLKLRPLILAIEGIADHIRVRPNSTLESTSEGHRFLRNARNIESFQTLPPFEELTRIAEMAGDSPPLETLVRRISAADAVEGDENDVRAFLERLIAEGFLELDAGISATDPDWDLGLVSLLQPIAGHCEPAAAVIAAMTEIREELRLFAGAGLAERNRIVVRCHARLKGLVDLLVAAAAAASSASEPLPPPGGISRQTGEHRDPRADQQHLLYEDSAIPNVAIQINSRDLAPIAASLSTLSRHLSFMDGVTDSRARLAHYCAAKYGRADVPLIRVYEDYYRDYKVPEQSRKQGGTPGTSEPPLDYPGMEGYGESAAARSRMIAAWVEAVATRLRTEDRLSDERVDVTAGDLAQAGAALPSRHQPRAVAGSAYLQLVTPAEGAHCLGVVNGVAPGYGKMMSRFLDMFPEEVTTLNRLYNRRAAGESLLAEVRDASFSNANMHPPLLDFEISSPGAQTSFPPEKQISVSDLYVVCTGDAEPAISLMQRSTGRRVEVIDLGFLGWAYRSQLLQLLVHGFSRAQYISFYPLLTAVNGAPAAPPPNGISRHPRVVFDDRLVLQRRAWTVGCEAWPARKAGETEASFYLRINDWRESNGMPAHVFVFLTRDREAGRKKGTKLARDDYKPQYISFRNYFTIDLFERIRTKASQSVYVEEMLPASDSMLRIAGRPYAAELIVQWAPRIP